MLGFDPEGDVRGHDAAGDVGHAAGHHDHQFGFRKLIQKRPDGEGSFRLAHEDAGGHVEGLRAAGAHDARHDPGGSANDELHDADVIEQREKSGDENNRGENLESKNEVFRRSGETGRSRGGQAELAKDKLRAVKGVAEEQIDVVSGLFKKIAARGEAQNKNGERKLQAETPKHSFEFDGLAIGGEEIREAEHCEQAKHSGETSHALSSFCRAGKNKIVDALAAKNAADERAPLARRSFADLIAGGDETPRFRQLCSVIVMNCYERLAFFYTVANAFVKFEADSVVDTVFLFFTTTAKGGKGGPELLAICCADKACGRTGNTGVVASLREQERVVDDAFVTALETNALLEFFFGLAAREHGFGEMAAFVESLGALAEEKHPAR